MNGNKAQRCHHIVIIGASFGGLAVAHRLMKVVIPSLPSPETYKVTIISPNQQFFWNVGAPRQVVNPEMLPAEKLFLDFVPGLQKYQSEFEHTRAYAIAVDPLSQLISFASSREGPATGSIHYDRLILASGTSFNDPIWSVQSGEAVTKEALERVHTRLADAKRVVVVGGGATGVETAGELGWLHGQSKHITLLSGSSKLLSKLKDERMGRDAESRLKSLGVEVVHGLRLQDSWADEHGGTIVKLTDGSEKHFDAVIDATGERPNNKFIPEDWLTKEGFVKSDIPTLRADIPGIDNIYVIGSIGSYSDGSVPSVLFAYKILCESIRIDLAGESDGPNRTKVYKPLANDMQIIPIGPRQGVATTFGYKWPSCLVALYKSRNFNVSYANGFIKGETL